MSEVLTFRRREDERSEAIADLDAGESPARFAIANTLMEGGTVHQETETLLENWSNGEVSDDELIDQTWQRFARGG